MEQQVVDMNLLAHYKDLYSGHKILYVRFLDNDFIFRSLTRKEYKYLLQSGLSQMDMEDSICNTTCLYPEDYDFTVCGFAGLNEYVANIIKDISDFSDIRSILNEYHKYKEMDNLETQCMDLIKAFIPEYTYEEMEEWTWEKLMQITVRAEKVAALRGFEWSLKDESEQYIEEMQNINSENKEFLKELETNGIDPMFYFEDEIKHTFKKEVLDFPLIGGSHWNDEVVLSVIREQIRKADYRSF